MHRDFCLSSTNVYPAESWGCGKAQKYLSGLPEVQFPIISPESLAFYKDRKHKCFDYRRDILKDLKSAWTNMLGCVKRHVFMIMGIKWTAWGQISDYTRDESVWHDHWKIRPVWSLKSPCSGSQWWLPAACPLLPRSGWQLKVSIAGSFGFRLQHFIIWESGDINYGWLSHIQCLF